MQSVIRAYPSLPGPESREREGRRERGGERKRERERVGDDSLTSVEHTVSVIAGIHMAQAEGWRLVGGRRGGGDVGWSQK